MHAVVSHKGALQADSLLSDEGEPSQLGIALTESRSELVLDVSASMAQGS